MTAQHTHTAPEGFDAVHARVLRGFPELVGDLGGDCRALLSQVGLDPAALAQGEVAATYRQMVLLIELAAGELHCPDFGLRLAMRQGGGMFGPLGRVMKNSRTFGEALDYVSRHAYAHSLAARISLRWSPTGETVFSSHDILLDRMTGMSQAMEQILLVGHLAAMEITGGHARVRRVDFRHQPVSALKVYRRYFGCEVRFGQSRDGVVFSARDMACPILDPDAGDYRSATSFIDSRFTRHSPPLHAQARGLIRQSLGAQACTNEAIAAALNLHPRTLHRRLTMDGTSFQQIKDDVRRDLALYYLQQTDLDFTHISERLGFAEQSVLTRRCNRWFSASPTRVRAESRALVPAG